MTSLSTLSKVGFSLAAALAFVTISGIGHAECLVNESSDWLKDSDYSGGDFRSVYPSAGAPRCSVHCQDDVNCVAWTYVESNDTCYLKNVFTRRVSAPGMTTGRRFEPSTNYDGNDYMEIPGSTPGVCHEACLDDSEYCRAWTWVQSNKTCYLKDSFPTNKTTVQGMVSARYSVCEPVIY